MNQNLTGPEHINNPTYWTFFLQLEKVVEPVGGSRYSTLPLGLKSKYSIFFVLRNESKSDIKSNWRNENVWESD